MNNQSRIHIGNVIRNAVVFNLRNRASEAMDSDSLLQNVSYLFTLLGERQVDYVLVGGVALLAYIEGRNTQDIDLIMASSSLKKVPEIQIKDEELYFARGQFRNLQIDILLTKNPLFNRVKQRYTTVQRFLEQDIPSATVEGLLLLKLYALPSLYRQGNFTRVGLYENDIATLIYDYQPPLEPLLDQLGKYLDKSDLLSVREIVVEIKQRIERFRKGSSENL